MKYKEAFNICIKTESELEHKEKLTQSEIDWLALWKMVRRCKSEISYLRSNME